MKNIYKQKLIKSILAIFLLMLASTGISASVSASELPKQSTSSTYEPNAYITPPIYVTKYDTFNVNEYTKPPYKKYFYHGPVDGILYGGELTLYSYANADGVWLAEYVGYVYPLRGS